MRLSEFWRLMADEFGEAYAASLASDMVLNSVGGRTAREALDACVPPRTVWLALCEAKEVPLNRRLGKDIKPSA